MADNKWKIFCNSCDATFNSEYKHIMPEGWRWNKQDGHRCPACLEIDNAIVADNHTQHEIGHFKGQQKSHIMLNDGIDKRYTLCSDEYRKEYDIESLCSSFATEQAKMQVTCPDCLRKLAMQESVAGNHKQYEIDMRHLPSGTTYIVSKGDERVLETPLKTLAYRIIDTLNAADGMPTAQAVKAIEHYEEMLWVINELAPAFPKGSHGAQSIKFLLAKLEVTK